MHGPLNIKQTLFAPFGYRNPTIQTVAAISRIALSFQESTLIVSLALNMSEHFFQRNNAFRWERMQHLTSLTRLVSSYLAQSCCLIPYTLRNTNTVIQLTYFPILNRFNLRLILQEIHSMWDACIINCNNSRNSVVLQGSYISNLTNYLITHTNTCIYIYTGWFRRNLHNFGKW